MRLAPIVVGAVLGRRLPVTRGTLRVDGLQRPVSIRRDRWGIPHIDASTDEDAWFGLGFCQGQDRAFQLEMLLRVVRGTLSELVGAAGLPVDRLSRRIGFERAARAQVALLGGDVRAGVEAFARGVTAAYARGLRRRPHELVLLRGHLTPWTAVEVLGVLKVESFALASNWDLEMARWKILLEDGPEALRDLDPSYPEWQPVAVPPGARARRAVAQLAGEVAALSRVAAMGGSNNWVLSAARTDTGRPLLANDPHLAPVVPGPWYLAHVRTPEWALAGAAFVGGPAVPLGHNGYGAWGVTAGLADTTDCFVEDVGPDGASVREGDRFVPCEVRVERIAVKGAPAVEERVLVTRRGPIIGPALGGDVGAISLRATWLDPKPADGLLALHRARSFADFRRAFVRWREVSLNMVYADVGGTIGYQLVGEVPRRIRGDGSIPVAGREVGAGWTQDPVPFDEMPSSQDPPAGWIATANTKPLVDGEGPDLGVDFIDGYRLARIVERVAEGRDRDLASTMRAQLDVASIPWREMRGIVLDAAAGVPRGAAGVPPGGTGVPPGGTRDASVADARAHLEAWDGQVAVASSGAALYELFVADLCVRVAQLRAPKAYRYALGAGFDAIVPLTVFAARRVGHLVRALRERPEGWCGHPWSELIRASLASAWAALRDHAKSSRSRENGGRLPGWGEIRPLTLRHAFTGPVDKAFDLGPFPWGGDANTVSQAAVDPLLPTSNPLAIASARGVIDVGNWEAARFVLPGGQSGNPCSPHYDDQLPLWRRGEGVPIAWGEDAVATATKETLRLEPA